MAQVDVGKWMQSREKMVGTAGAALGSPLAPLG